ncbi:hypothetical protein SDC9_211090 [bioreactor metagenome]|uniref:Uncharacterized protein n=1 Tax=bioreactor metagenome TaxID=1076179 RepID=A0A645JJC5_9ZZZZ
MKLFIFEIIHYCILLLALHPSVNHPDFEIFYNKGWQAFGIFLHRADVHLFALPDQRADDIALRAALQLFFDKAVDAGPHRFADQIGVHLLPSRRKLVDHRKV